jgi:hypothetical protein
MYDVMCVVFAFDVSISYRLLWVWDFGGGMGDESVEKCAGGYDIYAQLRFSHEEMKRSTLQR